MLLARAALLAALGVGLLLGCAVPQQSGLPNAPIFNTGVRATVIPPGENAPAMPGQGAVGVPPGSASGTTTWRGIPGTALGPGAPPPGTPPSAYGSPYGNPSDLSMLGGAVTVDTRQITHPRSALTDNPLLWPFAVVAWPFEKIAEGISHAPGGPSEEQMLDQRAQSIIESGGAPSYSPHQQVQMDHERAQLEAMQQQLARQQAAGGGGAEGVQVASRGGAGMPSIADELEALRKSGAARSAPTAAVPGPTATGGTAPGGTGADLVEDRNHDGRPDHWVFGQGASRTREVFDDDGDGRPDRTVYYEPGGQKIARVEQDTNGDGKVDVWTLYENGHVAQRRADTNHDGQVDTWTFYDASGKVTKQAQDLDGDGQRDRAEVYENGVLVSRTEDTNGDGLPDKTTRFDAKGRPIEEDVDTNHDGQVDVRSYFKNGKLVRRELLGEQQNAGATP
jgi:antitoxin component YwqK of YwqJK toxin-antitoxin module